MKSKMACKLLCKLCVIKMKLRKLLCIRNPLLMFVNTDWEQLQISCWCQCWGLEEKHLTDVYIESGYGKKICNVDNGREMFRPTFLQYCANPYSISSTVLHLELECIVTEDFFFPLVSFASENTLSAQNTFWVNSVGT